MARCVALLIHCSACAPEVDSVDVSGWFGFFRCMNDVQCFNEYSIIDLIWDLLRWITWGSCERNHSSLLWNVVAEWLGCWILNQKVMGSNPGNGTAWYLWAGYLKIHSSG
jgi:hypothetical protein